VSANHSRLKTVWVSALGLLSLAYLLNPGAGVFELIPDNLPLLGNLDEATAVALLLASLRYFGLDLTAFLPGSPKRKPKDIPPK
jgi:uncharacterized membrane protein YkvA (DUF1232 family)